MQKIVMVLMRICTASVTLACEADPTTAQAAERAGLEMVGPFEIPALIKSADLWRTDWGKLDGIVQVFADDPVEPSVVVVINDDEVALAQKADGTEVFNDGGLQGRISRFVAEAGLRAMPSCGLIRCEASDV